MSLPIDEATAWSLVRHLKAAQPGHTAPLRVSHHSRADVWLQVDPAGPWTASAPVNADAEALIELYLPLQLQPDLTIGQLGQSLDGRIATRSGDSHYITGQADIRRLHRLRALVDAVVVGAGTVSSDDPRLTVREVEGDNPVRVVLDPTGRLTPDRHVFTDHASRTIHVRRAPPKRTEPTLDGDVLWMPWSSASTDAGSPSGPGFAPGEIRAALSAMGLRRLLVEGGGVTVSRFLQTGALDRLHVTIAPLLIGSGPSAVTLEPIESLAQAVRPPCRWFTLGHDVLCDLDLR